MLLRGEFRDPRAASAGGQALAPWRPNLVVWSAMDLVGALLCNRSTGVTYLAVGAGDPQWDQNPPAPDRARRRLTAEVLRVRLQPGTTLTYDAATGRVHARALIDPATAAGPLRELGLFGGDASSRPGSGVLVNHAIHPPVEPVDDRLLEREVALTLAPSLAAGARDLIGGLLTRKPGLAGLTHVALGTSAAAVEGQAGLAGEAHRKRIAAGDLAYDAASHAVVAGASFDIGEGPDDILESGLFGGTASDRPGSGLLVARETGDAIDRREPKRLRRRFQLVLVAKTGIAVPDLAGQTLDEARAAIAAAELQLADVSEQEAESVGRVLAQSPAPGAVVNEGAPIALVVAVPITVVVPEIVGEPADEATALLESLGLLVPADARVVEQSRRPRGTVLASSPPAGTRVVVGSSVALTVAVAVRVLVPDLRGMTPAAASVVLRGVELVVAAAAPSTQESGATPGTIVTHDPDAGSEVEVGSDVRVTLATPWTVAVPDLRSTGVADAPAALAKAAAPLIETLGLPSTVPGLAIGAISDRVDPAPTGAIVDQSPAAGARVALYATIDLSVSTAQTRTVPTLVGLAQGTAVAALTAAELAAGHVRQRPAEQAPGTVVDQEPAAGAQWPRGGPVTITVAAGRRVAVPDLAGVGLEAARESLADVGLVVGTATAQAGAAAPGSVLHQDPPAGAEVDFGSAVNLVVGAGIPDVTGMNEEDAIAAIKGAGLTLGETTRREIDGPAGLVLAQEPPPGSAVTPTTLVRLVVSILRGVEVPALVGSPVDKAQQVLAALGIELQITGKAESDEPGGTILAQDPQAGGHVQRGGAVLVTIGVARPPAVPQLVGLAVSEAEFRLRSLGLALEVAASRPDPGVPPGTIVSQKPAAGARVPRGSVVAVVLAAAAESVEVPDVRNMLFSDAAALLQKSSLVGRTTGASPSTLPKGTVLTQNPVAGTRAPSGSAVLMVLSDGSQVVVPKLAGFALQVAETRCAEAGLRARSEPMFSTGKQGIVLQQNPQTGAQVPRGSLVTLFFASTQTPGPRPEPPIE
ncbi:MAG: PASTA domain-containing protein [Solirubrobacteraceae bacterium]